MQTEVVPGYELQLGEFKGPLEKLLELIDKKKLDITRVSLAEVTADFLAHVERLEGRIERRELADFVVVAAKLILLKSHSLLPGLALSDEEERDLTELEEHLKLYRQLKAVETIVQDLWGEHTSFARPFLANTAPGFYLSEALRPGDLHQYLIPLAEDLEKMVHPAEEEVRLVSLEEKIGELMGSIGRVVQASFNELKYGKNKNEIIIMFLALLHLLKDSAVSIEQEEGFADIRITGLRND